MRISPIIGTNLYSYMQNSTYVHSKLLLAQNSRTFLQRHVTSVIEILPHHGLRKECYQSSFRIQVKFSPIHNTRAGGLVVSVWQGGLGKKVGLHSNEQNK